ncbi:DUF6162 family protein [Neorhizobium alkalisoli]|uniref:Uncharacterized protein n=1 Tax=Neorhizobium alkalisoli TaxID=528178 RepID=A0A561Q840_9HYPH|nr:DUF6162 family protein [Neorhizobium alkalisoli]TWF46525.1 hypothetical protein FHW37_11494 [Neorhizobium alkalisoli]
MREAPQTRLVRPAGAGAETVLVLILCGAILITSTVIVALRTAPAVQTALANWQIDARMDLTAAEQGINADLRIAADDIAVALQGGEVPTAEALAAEALAPFLKDATTGARGGHAWVTIEGSDGFTGWLGRSASPELAGSMLLRIAADGETTRKAGISVWLKRSTTATVARLTDEALISSGWKEITIRYDASVTRDLRP